MDQNLHKNLQAGSEARQLQKEKSKKSRNLFIALEQLIHQLFKNA